MFIDPNVVTGSGYPTVHGGHVSMPACICYIIIVFILLSFSSEYSCIYIIQCPRVFKNKMCINVKHQRSTNNTDTGIWSLSRHLGREKYPKSRLLSQLTRPTSQSRLSRLSASLSAVSLVHKPYIMFPTIKHNNYVACG